MPSSRPRTHPSITDLLLSRNTLAAWLSFLRGRESLGWKAPEKCKAWLPHPVPQLGFLAVSVLFAVCRNGNHASVATDRTQSQDLYGASLQFKRRHRLLPRMSCSWISCALSDSLQQDGVCGGGNRTNSRSTRTSRHQTELFGPFKKNKKKKEKGYRAVPLNPEQEMQLREGFRNVGKCKGGGRHGASWGSVPLAPHQHPGAQRPRSTGERSQPPFVLAAGLGRPPAAAGGRERGRGRLLPAPGGCHGSQPAGISPWRPDRG